MLNAQRSLQSTVYTLYSLQSTVEVQQYCISLLVAMLRYEYSYVVRINFKNI